MLSVIRSSKFNKDVDRILRSKTNINDLKDIIEKLSNNEPLDKKYKAHSLKGKYKNYKECHIKPDLLLIYKITPGELYLYRLSSHSDLFGECLDFYTYK